MPGNRRRASTTVNIWPGFVDALAALLLLLVFMVMIFTLAQVFLAETVSDRDAQLSRLNDRLAEISESLRLERASNEELSEELSELRADYESTLEREAELEDRVASLEEEAATDEATIERQLREQASLQQDIVALREVRSELEAEVADLVSRLDASESEAARLEDELQSREALVGSLRDRTQSLQSRLAEEEERTLLAQEEIEEQDLRIQDLQAIIDENEEALTEERRLSASARAEVERLTAQVEDLRAQLETISRALALEEETTAAQEAELAELGERLNTLLAERVNELEQYRSEFFGRLREVLVDNPDIRIEGDRFVLPSELFFSTGSATLGDAGGDELDKLAETLTEIAAEIPDDLEWILRIDGHTDRRPISTDRFPSNWELSTARAVSVVRYLTSQGIPADRLAAAGFGEHHPIDPANTPEAFQRNRRIEIKLTNR